MTHPLSRDLCKPKDGQRLVVDGVEYILRGKLGDGAAGLVRKVDRTDGTQLAIKFVAPDPKYIEEAAFDDVKARFKREGEKGAHLDHYALLKIWAYSDNENGSAFATGAPKNPFLLMERSSGGTVEDFIRRLHPTLRGVLILDETRLRIAIQMAEALEYLHKRKIVHRDVKPGNVFLSSKVVQEDHSVRARLGDFGVVKWGDFHASLSTGTLTATMHKGLGTMKYMPPEQALHPKEVDVKADIFSFGVTLFELLSGQILPTFYHVYEIMMAREAPGTTVSRWHMMNVQISAADEAICGLILEMVRKGVTRRPSIQAIRGKLEYEYEQRLGKDWARPDGENGHDEFVARDRRTVPG